MNKHNIKINFAHQTFKWGNEAKGNAAVHCVIVGFSLNERKEKRLFLYENMRGETKEVNVKRINVYLVDAENIFIESRKTPICDVPEMYFGNMPNDGGQFLLDEEEKKALIKNDATIKKLIRPFLGAIEFINNIPRYCIWLKEVPPDKYNHSREILRRIAEVKRLRENSPREATRNLAALPMLFGEIRQPNSDYLLIPRVSSERRRYIPIGFLHKNIIVGDSCICVPNATLYHFGILTSAMHNAWMRHVCGRLEIDYRYSISIVYNNFPFPNKPTEKQTKNIENAAQMILDTRAKFPNNSLAELYNPLTMPSELVKAHQKLDKLVEKCYGKKFDNDAQRVAYLFELYQKLTGELFAKTKKGK
jgi:hypothetical protein